MRPNGRPAQRQSREDAYASVRLIPYLESLIRHAYLGFSGIIYPESPREPRKHWAKNIFRRVQNRSRLSVRAPLVANPCGTPSAGDRSRPSAETRKPTTRGLLRSRNDAGKARFDGLMGFLLTIRLIPIFVSPVTAPCPRRFALRVVPASSDTKCSASRMLTKMRFHPLPITSSATRAAFSCRFVMPKAFRVRHPDEALEG